MVAQVLITMPEDYNDYNNDINFVQSSKERFLKKIQDIFVQFKELFCNEPLCIYPFAGYSLLICGTYITWAETKNIVQTVKVGYVFFFIGIFFACFGDMCPPLDYPRIDMYNNF